MKLRRLIDSAFDFVLLAGFASIVYGVSRFSRPASWIVLGVLLVAAAVLAAAGRRGHRLDPEGKEE